LQDRTGTIRAETLSNEDKSGPSATTELGWQNDSDNTSILQGAPSEIEREERTMSALHISIR
jgi:hypothetical protein